MASTLPSKVLVVDNDQGVLNLIAKGLQAHKIETVVANDWGSALYQFNAHKIDMCIIANELEDLTGTALIQKWRNHEVESKRNAGYILSVSRKHHTDDEALFKELGNIGVVYKPIKIPQLLSIMANNLSVKKGRESLELASAKVIKPLMEEGNFEKACEIAKAKLEPLGAQGVFMSSQIHIEAGKTERAIELLKGLIEKDHKNMAYHNELGKLYLKLGQLKEAKKAYELADSVAPGNMTRVEEMAHMYLQMNLPEKSIEKFKATMKLNPEKPDMKFDMYDAIAEAGFVEHAQQFCKETSTPKELVRHFNNKGVLYSKEGEYIDAIDEYAKAKKLIPGSKELHKIIFNQALAYMNLKTDEGYNHAEELLQECLNLDPSFEKAKEKLELNAKLKRKKHSESA